MRLRLPWGRSAATEHDGSTNGHGRDGADGADAAAEQVTHGQPAIIAPSGGGKGTAGASEPGDAELTGPAPRSVAPVVVPRWIQLVLLPIALLALSWPASLP
jgi:hypothetical protein